MSLIFVVIVWFVIAPIALHELGHWLILTYYKISFDLFFDWKGLMFGFEEHSNSPNALKAGLAGAFLPLLILIPCILLGNFYLIGLGLIACLVMSIWACVEVWFNVDKLNHKNGRK